MKRISQAEIAKRAGVSEAAVSRVVNNSGYVAEDIRKKIETVIAETGYSPAPRVSAHGKRRNVIGVIVPNTTIAPYFERMQQCMQDACEVEGFAAIVAPDSKLNNRSLREQITLLNSLGVCGIVICSFRARVLDMETRELLESCKVPVVFIERTASCHGFHRILVDNRLGTYEATKCLLQKGHKKLMYLTKSVNDEVETHRQEGFLDAVRESGLSTDDYIIKICDGIDTAAAYEAARSAFAEHPDITGVATWNDVYAQAVLYYCYQNGLKVPQDVEIIGNDDVLASHMIPPISSVHMPLEEMAAATVRIIQLSREQSRSFSPRTVSLEPKLIIR